MKCVLCARRGKQTEGETHCCVACGAWLQRELADVMRLCVDAAASIDPLLTRTSAGGSRPVPGSRPPLNVQALDPELTIVDGKEMTVLGCLELWERMLREMRRMPPYGPVSAARARTAPEGYSGTAATLVGVVNFLGRQVAWMTTEPDWPIDDFADEVRACTRVLRHWDAQAQERGTMVRCPTMTNDDECGYRLSYRDMDEQVTCRRCGQTRDASTLALIAMSDGREVWLDPEAAAKWLCIAESTLRLWAKQGRIRRSHGRYLMPHTAAV